MQELFCSMSDEVKLWSKGGNLVFCTFKKKVFTFFVKQGRDLIFLIYSVSQKNVPLFCLVV